MDPKKLDKLQLLVHHAETLKTDDLIPLLYSQQAINNADRHKLLREIELKGSNAQASLLIEILKKKDSSAFDKFVSALENTGQKELAHQLQHEVSLEATLSSTDRNSIQGHFSELVNGLKITEIVEALKKEKNYFTPHELGEIQSIPNDRKKVERFLSEVIMKGSYRHLALLKKTCRDLGQERLADLLPVNLDILLSTSRRLDPELIILYVTLIMSRPIEDLRALVVSKINDPSQDLRRKLILQYELSTLQAEAEMGNNTEFSIKMIPRKSVLIHKVQSDVDNGHLELIIKQYSKLSETPSWQVKITTKLLPSRGDGASAEPRLSGQAMAPSYMLADKFIDSSAREREALEVLRDRMKPDDVIPNLVAQGLLTSSQIDWLSKDRSSGERNAYILREAIFTQEGSQERIEKFKKVLEESGQETLVDILPEKAPDPGGTTLRFPEVPPPKPQSSSRQTDANLGPGQLPIVKGVIHNMINGKDHTQYDVWTHLKKYKGKVYDIPNQLRNEDGLNLLHLCVDKGRLSLFLALMHMGWWKFLSEQKIPEDSINEHRGRIAKQIADVKRTRKPIDEINMYTEWENSLSSVMKACRQGDEQKVKQQLRIEVEQIHYRDSNNGNALYWAVVGGKLSVLKLLLDNGIDPTMKTKKGETLLHIACMLGHSHMIATLHEKLPAGSDKVEDQNHKTPFDRVAENGDVDTLIEMMKCKMYPEESFPATAAHSGRKPCLEYCLELLKMPVDSKDMYDRTPLHRAIEGGKIEITRYLLDKNPRLDLLTSSLRSVLHIAAECGNISLAGIILDVIKRKRLLNDMLNEKDRYNGVDLCFLIRGRDRGRDAWHYVEVQRWKVPVFLKKTKSGNVDVATYGTVIKSGWGVNPDQDVVDEIENMFKNRRLNQSAPRDMTPLHIAIFKGHTEVTKMILEHGARVNEKDKFNLTPLMMAAAKGFLEIIQELEHRGAKYKEVNIDGKTATEIAEENEHDEIVNYVKGRDYFQMCTNFLQGDMVRLKEELSPQRLDAVRASGADVKRHIVNTLRDFRIDINQFLLDLGSGPVLEASEN